MKTYLAYVRVSTARQGERGSSLQEQRSAIEAYAQRNSLAIAAWFEERETAAKSGRPQFSAMMTELRRRHAAGVIIHKIDRSARNLRDWAQLGELVDLGVELHFVHETLDLASRGGRLAADIQAVVAADFIRNLRQETRKGIEGRLKQGIYPFRAPLGYVDCGGGKPKEPHPLLAGLVREAFELYATGAYGLDQLRRVMHRRGLLGHSGRGLSRNGMATVLHNPFYMGIIHIRRTGASYPGVHRAIVDAATFKRVQEVLSGRFYRRTIRHRFSFSRLLRCARCGRSLIGERQKGHVYYRCHSNTCQGTSVTEMAVMHRLIGLFATAALSEEEVRDLRDFGADDAVNRIVRERNRREQARLSLARCDERLDRLTDAYLDEAVDRAVYEHRKARLLEDRRTYAEVLESQADPAPEDEILKKLELGNTAQQQLKMADTDEKREIVNLMMSNLFVSGKKLDLRLQFPFDEVEKWRLHRECDPCRAQGRRGPAPCAPCTDIAALRARLLDGASLRRDDAGVCTTKQRRSDPPADPAISS